MAEPFADRFAAARARFGPLVWGLDPSGRVLEQWGLGDSPDGLEHFVDIALDVASGTVGVVKPQSAFYERHGWRGIRALGRLCSEARRVGMLVVLDAKRGDVGSTNDAYAEAYLGKGASLEVDALTVHPYLGLDAMGSYFTRAAAAGSCVLIVTRSSNPEGRPLQAAVGVAGTTVEAGILAGIGRLNAQLCPDRIGPIGAVVGLRHYQPELDLVGANGLFLAPGLGAQGATVEDVARIFATCPTRVMPSASRALLNHGPHAGRLRDALADLARSCRDRL